MRGTRLVMAGLLAGALAPAAAGAKAPTAAQIRHAVRAVERSPDLWATVNICDTRAHPHTLGVRGQMPALGFAADLRMTFELDYFSQAHQRFEPLRGVRDAVDVGWGTRGIYQAGVRYAFRPHSGMLRGRVVFAWRLGGRTIGRATTLTSGAHRSARFGDPSGYSRASCVIG